MRSGMKIKVPDEEKVAERGQLRASLQLLTSLFSFSGLEKELHLVKHCNQV